MTSRTSPGLHSLHSATVAANRVARASSCRVRGKPPLALANNAADGGGIMVALRSVARRKVWRLWARSGLGQLLRRTGSPSLENGIHWWRPCRNDSRGSSPIGNRAKGGRRSEQHGCVKCQGSGKTEGDLGSMRRWTRASWSGGRRALWERAGNSRTPATDWMAWLRAIKGCIWLCTQDAINWPKRKRRETSRMVDRAQARSSASRSAVSMQQDRSLRMDRLPQCLRCSLVTDPTIDTRLAHSSACERICCVATSIPTAWIWLAKRRWA